MKILKLILGGHEKGRKDSPFIRTIRRKFPARAERFNRQFESGAEGAGRTQRVSGVGGLFANGAGHPPGRPKTILGYQPLSEPARAPANPQRYLPPARRAQEAVGCIPAPPGVAIGLCS